MIAAARLHVATGGRGRWIWAAAGLAAVVAVVWLAAGPGVGDAPQCLLRRETGIACPTCGLTRAFRLLLAGDVSGSLAAHPLAALLMAQAVLAWRAWGRWLARGGERPDRHLPRVVALDAAAFAAVWGVRALTGTLPG